jgi:hypothetical protein
MDDPQAKLRTLRDRLSATLPRVRMRSDASPDLERGMQGVLRQIESLLRIVGNKGAAAPDNLDEALEDAVAESMLLLHDCDRLLETQAKPRLHAKGSERRQHERYETRVAVRLLRHATRQDDIGAVSLTTETANRPARNVSTGGIFVTLGKDELPQIAVGNVVHVQVSGPGSGFQARAVVVRRDAQGLGLSWILDSEKLRRDVVAFLDAVRRGGAPISP